MWLEFSQGVTEILGKGLEGMLGPKTLLEARRKGAAAWRGICFGLDFEKGPE